MYFNIFNYILQSYVTVYHDIFYDVYIQIHKLMLKTPELLEVTAATMELSFPGRASLLFRLWLLSVTGVVGSSMPVPL